MNFSFNTSVPILTVFFQGLLSFLSPCVFPLVPLYVSYFAGGAKTVAEDGTIHYPRKKVFFNTIGFVLGISFTFFVLGFGFTALGRFFSDNRLLFARISGIIMILFGLYQLGVFGQSHQLEREHRFSFRLESLTMSPLSAFLLGFTFSFAWTPCVGPILGSVLLMAGSAGTAIKGFSLIGVYTMGFILPFLAVGLFTGAVLDFFKKHKNIIRYTVKTAAVLLILMGFMTLTGFMNGLTSYLSDFGTQKNSPQTSEHTEYTSETEETNSSPKSTPEDTEETSEAKVPVIPAPDFTLIDQYGNEHKLSDYQGKTIFLNFWATWCPPCRIEMPEIQALYEKYENNEGDLIVLGVASPNVGREKSTEYITSFLEENGYTFPVVMDEGGFIAAQYSIRAYPTTFMIDETGSVYGYVESALTGDMMESIVQQTMGTQTPPNTD